LVGLSQKFAEMAQFYVGSPYALGYSLFIWKGQCNEIFCFKVFHKSFSSKPLKIALGSFQIFLNIRGDIHNSTSTMWQIIRTIADCLHLKVNLKEKIYLYVTQLTKDVQTK
jgi:hypothetical protein